MRGRAGERGDASTAADERAAALVSRMTLDEKLAQLGAVWAGALLEDGRFSEPRARTVLRHGTGHVTRIGGSTVLGPAETAAVVNDVQRFCVEETRLGIPAIVHEESCAGYTARGATQFPQAIGLASTWEPGLVREMAEVIRLQMRAVGARQTLAPVLDVARDARWGRCEETFGEDPYLASRMGVAYVRGVQGERLDEGVAATAKHFAGYGASEGGLNWAPAPLPRRELLERFLPPFTAAIAEAGLASVMNGYHEIDGVPCGASRWLLDELLRGELGFEGVVVADYFTVVCLHSYHRIAADKSEAAARSLEAGLDVELPQRDCFAEPLLEAIARGRVGEGLVDRAVRRVLRLKLALGLFDSPYVDAAAAPAVFDTPAHRRLARRLAVKSCVLLQNRDGLLPLDPQVRRVVVLGPNADCARHLQGDYHYPAHLEIVFGEVSEGLPASAERAEAGALAPGTRAGDVDLGSVSVPTVTVLEGIRGAVGPETEVRFALGCDVTGARRDGIEEAARLAAEADVAIVVVGDRSGLLPSCTSGEAVDRADLTLPGVQAELVRAVSATGTPTVLVLVNGRPLALAGVAEHAAAILEAWLPGEEGGAAVAEVLFGRAAPGGKLPVTLPRAVGQLPLYYNHKPSGARSQFHGHYRDLPCTPLFPFGHGLSYTRFEYTGVSLSAREIAAEESLEIACDVANAGAKAGEEVVQLYVRDPVATVTRPVLELKGFARVALAPGEACRVHFVLDPAQLAFRGLDMQLAVEPGEIEIAIGGSSEDLRLRERFRVVGAPRAVRARDVRPTDVRIGPPSGRPTEA